MPQWLRFPATLVIGAFGGLVFSALQLPLAWMLGSGLACALAAQAGAPLQVPKVARTYAITVIGLMLGGAFDMHVLRSIVTWWPTILLTLVMTVLFLLLGLAVLRGLSTLDPGSRLLAAIPGGVSTVMALGEESGADMRRVASCHTARIVCLLGVTPALIGLISEYHLAGAGPGGRGGIDWALHPADLVVYLCCGLIGVAVQRRLALPAGNLLLPLALSSLAQLGGVIDGALPDVALITAQIVLGASIGRRFTGYRPADILRDGWPSAVLGLGMALVCLAVAWALERYAGLPAAPTFLALLPGGAPELSVISIALDIDPEWVATHQLVRVVFLSMILSRIGARRASS